jgi:asparagine N-glycosylation enzyme membrane subunit Stt3
LNKVDRIKEELANKREFLKIFLVLAMAMITGVVTIIYNVVSGSASIFMLVIAGLGFCFLIITMFVIRFIYTHLDKLTKELENV